jgi:proteasome accessory factor C
MAEYGTAADQLGRVLYLLPLANRKGGVALTEAADLLEVPVSTIQRDIEEVTARAFYHPAGGADELQILLEINRLNVFTRDKFTRPPKLSLREALAASLALRAAAVDAPAERRQAILDLAHRVDLELAVASAAELVSGFSVDEADADGTGLRTLLRDAARDRQRCRMRYLKPGDDDPSERELDPYQVVYGRGGWYVIGYCHTRDDIRVFRLDRILEASASSETFDAPDSFDPTDYVGEGRVFRSDDEHEVRVRYSSRIAPWIREKGPCEDLDDGSVAVRFTVADPGWVVRHVLQYGPEAEVLEPEDVRTLVVEAAGRMA